MSANVMFWGQIGWFVALAIIGIAIWCFRVYRKRPPQEFGHAKENPQKLKSTFVRLGHKRTNRPRPKFGVVALIQ